VHRFPLRDLHLCVEFVLFGGDGGGGGVYTCFHAEGKEIRRLALNQKHNTVVLGVGCRVIL
jgi:hypothetical protein